MTKPTTLTMSNHLFNSLVDVVSTSIVFEKHSVELESAPNLERQLFEHLSLKNAVVYLASQHTTTYEGKWVLAHCVNSTSCFYILETSSLVRVKNLTDDTECHELQEYNLDGRLFGFMMSLYAYIFMYYALIQRGRKAEAIEHRNEGYFIKKKFNDFINAYKHDSRDWSRTKSSQAKLVELQDFVEKYTKEDYKA